MATYRLRTPNGEVQTFKSEEEAIKAAMALSGGPQFQASAPLQQDLPVPTEPFQERQQDVVRGREPGKSLAGDVIGVTGPRDWTEGAIMAATGALTGPAMATGARVGGALRNLGGMGYTGPKMLRMPVQLAGKALAKPAELATQAGVQGLGGAEIGAAVGAVDPQNTALGGMGQGAQMGVGGAVLGRLMTGIGRGVRNKMEGISQGIPGSRPMGVEPIRQATPEATIM